MIAAGMMISPEDSAEAFVRVRATSTKLGSLDDRTPDVDGEVVVPVVCTCARCCRKQVFGGPCLRPLVKLCWSAFCPYPVDGGGNG